MTTLGASFLMEAKAIFSKQKGLGDKAMEQLSEHDFSAVLDPEANSIAAIVKHMRGNMRSRWTDFLTSDGEKADRFRDSEFELTGSERREEVLAWWEEGWSFVFAALEPLTPDDTSRTVKIRGQDLTVVSAILRQIDHYGQHVGQIVLLAKHAKGSDWKTLSIPRGKSEEFNKRLFGR